MDISKADIVISEAGRDSGKAFYVLAVDGDYVLLSDGKVRTVEKPKRKKIKHVRFAARIDSHVAEKIRSGDRLLNSELRRDLAANSRLLTVNTREAE